jgi:uncharacterized protein with HEPN domain
MKHQLGDIARINHIIDAITDIEEITKNVNLDFFLTSLEKKLAVERLLEIIGEASNHISEKILYGSETSTPWRKIIATRNLIVHEYFRINYKIIYEIATNEIIPLKIEIQSILKELENTNKSNKIQ